MAYDVWKTNFYDYTLELRVLENLITNVTYHKFRHQLRSPFEAGPSVPCGDGQSGSNNDQTYGARSRGQLTMIQEVDLEEDVDLGCISPDEIGLDDYDFDHTEYNYNDVNDEHDGDGRSNQTEVVNVTNGMID
ncbi:uncharacterized protein [Euphorbia lathyris]|uniref:uncharacterized protein isoform X2 n=1 Tax=Euphorbia lathyris TaxID=212925 RepID=UPI0033137963